MLLTILVFLFHIQQLNPAPCYRVDDVLKRLYCQKIITTPHKSFDPILRVMHFHSLRLAAAQH